MSAAPPVILIRQGELFAPERLGRGDLLLAGGTILRIGGDLRPAAAALGDVLEIDARDRRVIPGLIDQHIHLIGGGDANGRAGRVPELEAENLALAGITTAVGLLGVDDETRGLPLLLRKVQELRHDGISAFLYAGSMALPAPHLLGSVLADVALLDPVLGAKTAVAEALHPNPDRSLLVGLAGELMRARAQSGKAAVLHCHVGGLAEGLDRLFDLVERVRMPVDQVVPTHVNRTAGFSPVFQHAIRFAEMGGTIDFTCCVSRIDGNLTGVDVPDAVRMAMAAGVPLEQITVSTDGNVPVHVRDSEGRSTGLRVASPASLHRDLIRVVAEAGLPLERALPLVTTNVARVLGLSGRKGRLAPGLDADLVLLDGAGRIETVIAGGRVLVQQARPAQAARFLPSSGDGRPVGDGNG